jgi:very-short-patch-repair endonuclease
VAVIDGVEGSPLRAEVHARPSISLALAQAGVSVLDAVVLFNGSDSSLEGAVFEAWIGPSDGPSLDSGVETEVARLELPPIDARARVSYAAPALGLPVERLAALTAPETQRVGWRVALAGLELARGEVSVDLRPVDEWSPEQSPAQVLAAFVRPDHPVVVELVRRLELPQDPPSSSGTGPSPLGALWAALRGLDLSLQGAPAAAERLKVRAPEHLLRTGRAGRVELAALFASCVERLGLGTVLVWLDDGAVLVGVWLDGDRFPEAVVTDAPRLLTAEGLQLVDPSLLAGRSGKRELVTAQRSAATALGGGERLRFAVDVRAAREQRWPPLSTPFVALAEDAAVPGLAGDVLTAAARVKPAEAATVPLPAEPDLMAATRLRGWKERLLDLTLRNRMLAFRPEARTTLPLAPSSLAALAVRLAAPGAWVDLVADDSPTPPDGEPLRVALSDVERMARAVSVDRASRAALLEGGANTLFAALGFLEWAEPGGAAEGARLAPLLLVPVEIEIQRSVRRVRIRRAEDDVTVNVTLIEKLARDHQLDLSAIAGFERDDIAIDVDWVLDTVRQAIAGVDGWRVIDGAALAHLTFAKFLLWRDLEDNADRLLQSPVVQHLVRGGAAEFANPVDAVDPGTLDDEPAPLTLVLDSDATQTAAVWSALRGRSFVLQGPPGTGKSQTIANLVAAALGAGKRVLVVAEKMAALDVVQRRLREAGLGDWVLELHSHKANKREVIAQLAEGLRREATGAQPQWEARAADLHAARAELNAYVRALHGERPIGRSFYQASAQLLAVRTLPTIALGLRGPLALSSASWEELLDQSERFAAVAADVEPVGDHPLSDVRFAEWSESDSEAAVTRVETALEALSGVELAATELADALEVSPPTDLAAIAVLARVAASLADGPLPPGALDGTIAYLDAARAFASAHQSWQTRSRAVAQRWHPGIYRIPELPLYTRRYARFMRWPRWLAWVFLRAARRGIATYARHQLPDNATIAADLETALDVESRREPLLAERKRLMDGAAGTWTGDPPDELVKLAERAQDVIETLARAREAGHDVPDGLISLLAPTTPAERRRSMNKRAAEAGRAIERFRVAWRSLIDLLLALPLAMDGDLPAHRERLERWHGGLPLLRGWAFYNRACAALEEAGLGAVVDVHRTDSSRSVLAVEVPSLVERSVLKEWVNSVRDAEDPLRTFSGADRNRQIARFRKLDQAQLALAARQIAWVLEQRVPRVGSDVPDSSEPGILLREAGKKARQKSVRRLMQEIPTLIGRLKPCLLMSPLSVAQYLPADGRRFDLVVFDEASQIATHDAIGALARGNQVVVVGDSQQLPPTAFFLEEAVAARLPQQRLGWHYRSRHEDLIRFSNDHYYDGALSVFPAARSRAWDLGIHWHFVERGRYGKARSRTNPAEAKALVDHLVFELLRVAPGERSFGVVTFSLPQQALVADLLDEARRVRPEIEGHFVDPHEPVFVKNLESVQGDERDVILFSVGYGPDDQGRVWMNFGPLNREGGERRLNVAVSRARRQLRVFSSLEHTQIDLARTRSRGARHLQEFLRYAAERGSPPEPQVRPKEFPSAFEREVAEALHTRGWDFETRVGCGQYRVDLAVVHPERPDHYLLGVELDGPSYASAATARDRDRLRQQVLEDLGWRLHRIWSTDWWFDRKKELARLEQALDESLLGDAVPEEDTEPILQVIDEDEDERPTEVRMSPEVEPYVEAEPAAVTDQASLLHDADTLAELREVVGQVLAQEAPIHLAELTRRVGAAFGIVKVTLRAQKRVMSVAKKLDNPGVLRGQFVWLSDVDPETYDRVRGPTAGGEPAREVEHIPPEEIAHAVRRVLGQNVSMSHAELVRETARVFGIQRVGRKVSEAMGAGIELLVNRGEVELQGERVVAPQ